MEFTSLGAPANARPPQSQVLEMEDVEEQYFTITTEGRARETYYVLAASADARAQFEAGDVTVTASSEVNDVEIMSIEEGTL